MMRRLLTVAVSLLALGGAGAFGSAPSAGARARVAVPVNAASLMGFACKSTLNPTARTVSIVSVMRPVPGTRALAVRFTLLARTPGVADLHSVGSAGDLGRWLSPADPTLGRRTDDVWKLAKTVSDVNAPAGYRFSVQFRWKGGGGRVLATASRRTPLCHERELRPDLQVARVIVAPSARHPRRAHYVAIIANLGLTASGPFSIVFTPGTGAPAKSRTVASVGPGAKLRVPFSGPACRGASPPTVTADPGGRVDDFNPSNNTLTVACPSAPGD